MVQLSYIHALNNDGVSRKPKLVLLLSSLLFRHTAKTTIAQEERQATLPNW